MIRAPPDHRRKEKEMAQRLYEIFIIRWSDAIRFPDGVVSNMACHRGPIEGRGNTRMRLPKSME